MADALGAAVTMKAVGVLRPSLKWAAGLAGTIRTGPGGSRTRIRVVDATGRIRPVAVARADLA